MASMASMSLAKLTSLSTQTLSLLLERQRLQTMNQPAPAASTQNIIRNLAQLRSGILALEAKMQDGGGGKAEKEASALLRSQFARMRDMLGSDVAGIEPLPLLVKESENASELSPIPPSPPRKDTTYIPYSDEPPPSPENDASPPELLEQQRLLMEEQDAHLDHLSLSVTRQRDISLQINDELTVHNGLLDELGHDVDNTHGRLSRARKRLDRFSRGVKGNLSTYIIAGIILILLILIIIFKT